jgi:hypothetical protein
VSLALESEWESDWEEDVREAFWRVRERVCRVWWRVWEEPAAPRGLFVLSAVRDVVVDEGAGLRDVVVVASGGSDVDDESRPPVAVASPPPLRVREDSEDEFGRPSVPKVWRRRREVGPRESREAWADVRLLDEGLDIVVDWLIGCVVSIRRWMLRFGYG